MFRFVRTVVFHTFGLLDSTQKDRMSPLPAVLALEDTRVYVYTSNSSDVAFYIKASVDQSFCLTTTLDIPDIYLNNGYV